MMQLGKYEIRRQIGKGSMGVVYEAFDLLIERSVAIKVIREDEFAPSERSDLLARLRREAQAAGRLNHPAIVAIHGYDELTDATGASLAYIVMELIVGQELKAFFDANHRFLPDEIERLMCALLDGLEHAHAKGVTHRDIKPANVILTPSGAVKVADFGIARIDSSELTQTGMLLGTPAYMAPEQLLGLDVDSRSDLFACGVLLYQFLTGVRPFNGSVATVIQKVLNEPAPPVTQANTALVPAWDRLLEKALAKKPQDRFQTAAAFADAIRRATRVQAACSGGRGDADRTVVMAQEPVSTVNSAQAAALGRRLPREPIESVTPLQPPLITDAAAVAVPTGLTRRRMGIGAVAAAGAVALAGAYLWLRPSSPTSATPSRVLAASAASPFVPSVAAGPAANTARLGAASATASVAALPSTGLAAPGLPPASSGSAASTAAVRAAAASLAVARPPAAVVASKPAAVAIAAVAKPAAAMPDRPAEVPLAQTTLANEWKARLLRLNAAGPNLDLAGALTQLLDVRDAEQRRRLVAFDQQLVSLKPYSALALGTKNGWLRYALRVDRPNLEQARLDALNGCRAQPDVACRTVLRGASFDKAGFMEVAAGLGERSVGEVRERFIASLDRSRPLAAAAAPAPAPAAAPAPAPAATTTPTSTPLPTQLAMPGRPLPAWPAALAALRQERGQASLAQALTTLLQPDSDDDRQVLVKFERMMKRLPWKSALAMGEDRGQLYYGFASGDVNDIFAADRALVNCGRARNCLVVMVNGSFNNDAMIALASRLGARQQLAVREALLAGMRRSLESGR